MQSIKNDRGTYLLKFSLTHFVFIREEAILISEILCEVGFFFFTKWRFKPDQLSFFPICFV